jgi:hypothetical protein
MNMDGDKGGVNRPMAPWIPQSQRDSGVNLDEVCGQVEQAEAGKALDQAFTKIEKEK